MNEEIPFNPGIDVQQDAIHNAAVLKKWADDRQPATPETVCVKALASATGSANRVQVANFWLQPTRSFPDGAPQREEYETDTTFMVECARYGREWVEKYECCNPECKNRDCPQHWPNISS